MAQIRYFPLFHHYNHHHHHPRPSNPISFNPPLQNLNFSLSLSPKNSNDTLSQRFQSRTIRFCSGGGGGAGSGGGWSSGNHGGDGNSDDSSSDNLGFIGLFFKGWQSGVAADPQFPFKVVMEELVGVSACILGNMALRPDFCLDELDFIFRTLVVGSTLNFIQMYLLTPSKSHMFEPGVFGILNGFGTFMCEVALLAAVGFAAGLSGTAISKASITVRKNMDPNFETPNKAPPTLLNASTWAFYIGLGNTLRYQTHNGVEFVSSQSVPPVVFKTVIFVLRSFIEGAGGMSFGSLARMAGLRVTVADDSTTPNHEGLQSDK